MALVTIAQAQTTIQPNQRSPTGVKSKRGLFNFDDGLIGPPPPPPFHTIPYHQPSTRNLFVPAPNKWTNVFGFDDITYQGIFNDLNGINYGVPTQFTPPPTTAPSVYNNNGYGYVNYGAPHDYDSSYVSHDGRVVKQYSVHERHQFDHPDPREFRPAARPPTQTVSSQYPSFFVPRNIAQPRTIFTSNQNPNQIPNPNQFPNQNQFPNPNQIPSPNQIPNPSQFPNQNQIPNSNQVPTFLTRNHGPVALGSGGLGFIRLPNGDVYLGSGSLGYVSHKDHYDNVIEISSRRQKSHPRGPTTFGHSQL